jgi:hypothetical protein
LRSVANFGFSTSKVRFGLLLLRGLMLLIGCLGLLWGISNVARGADSDALMDLEAHLLKFETFNRTTAAVTLDSTAARDLDACDVHSQRALLLLEIPLADAALRSGGIQEFDQRSRSLEARAQLTLRCSPRDSLVWLVLFGLKIEHGLLDERTFDLLVMSYETSPNEAWIAIRRVVVAVPTILAAPEAVRERILTEFQTLIRHRFFEMPALAYSSASSQIRSALQARIDQLSAGEQAEFARAVQRLK